MTLLPLPESDEDLERIVARYARLHLLDDLAERYKRDGQAQHGIDVIARDRRPGGSGVLWAFQCKCTKTFEPADLRAELKLLASAPHDVAHYVVVTTARVSERVQDEAICACSAQTQVAVWDWTRFSERAIEAGLGPWLPAAVRQAARAAYASHLVDAFQHAHVLYPRTSSPHFLRDVWVDPVPEPLSEVPTGVLATRRLSNWLEDPAVPRLVLVGDMGTGKTVGLLHAAERIGRRVLDGDAHCPLPVRVAIRDLIGRSAVEAITYTLLPCTAAVDLWNDPASDWLVWVDGLDEVRNPREASRAISEIETIAGHARVVGIAVVGRPAAMGSVLREAVQLRLGAWSPLQVCVTARRLAGATDEPVSARPAIPLYATLAALHVRSARPSPGLERLLAASYDDWAAERGLTSDVWQSIRPGLEELALGVLLAEDEFEPLAAKAFGLSEHVTALQRAEDLGILVRDASDGIAFADAQVETALAASALARRSDDEIRALAKRSDLADVLRLAVGRILEESPDRLSRLLPDLAGRAHHTAEGILGWLDAAIDLLARPGDPNSHLLSWTVDLACTLMLREPFSWHREATRERMSRLAALPEPVWTTLWTHVQAYVDHPADRARWFASRAFADLAPAEWRELLFETPSVRAVAAAKLVDDVASPETLDALLWLLLDNGHAELSGNPPAVAAGASLRSVAGSPRDRVVALATALLGTGRQHSAGGAAVALLPGEADVGALLGALRSLAMSVKTKPVIDALEALRAVDGATDWLGEHWPDAPTEPWIDLRTVNVAQTPDPPPSAEARRELLLGLAPGLLGDPARAQRLWGDHDLLTALCRAGDHQPDRLIELLRSPHLPLITPEGQVALGRAARANDSVAQALVEAWPTSRARLASSYPGLALEPLIVRDPSNRATAVYCEWLPHFPFAQPLTSARMQASLARDVLELPAVNAAARAWVRTLWRRATVGETADDGTTTRLHEVTLGAVLGATAPVWCEDNDICADILARAQSGAGQWLSAALSAWSNDRAPASLIDIAAQRLRALWREPDTWTPHEVPLLLRDIRRHGAAALVVDVADDILARGWGPGALQAMLVVAERSGDLAARSTELAAHWPRVSLTWQVDREDAVRLVEAAPSIWAARLEHALDHHGPMAADVALEVLELLASVRLDEAAFHSVTRLLTWFDERRLLWVRLGGSLHSVNSADWAMRLRRDLGLPVRR